MLITEGVQFESWLSTVVLKNEPGLQPVTLRGRPQGAGELLVTGYSSTVMGVTSNCRFKFLPHFRLSHYTINVVAALPMLQASDCGPVYFCSVRCAAEWNNGDPFFLCLV